MTEIIIIIFLLLVYIWLAFTKPYMSLVILVTLTPFQGLLQLTPKFNLIKALGLILVLIIFIQVAVRHQKLIIPKILIPYLMLFVWGAISIAWSREQIAGLIESTTLLMLVGQVIIMFNFCKTKKQICVLLFFYALGCGLLFVYGQIYGFTTLTRGPSSERLAIGTNENEVGLFVEIAVMFSVYIVFLSNMNKIAKGFAIAAGIGNVPLLIISQSRAAWISLACALTLWAIFALRVYSPGTGKSKVVLAIGGGVLFVALGYMVANKSELISEGLQQRFVDLFQSKDIDDLSGSRNEIWKSYSNLIFSNAGTMLLGVGNGSGITSASGKNWGRVISTHNDPINIMAETGIIGLFLYLIYLLRIVKNILAMDTKGSQTFCFALFIAIIVFGMFHTTLYMKQNAIIYGVIISLVYANKRKTISLITNGQ